MSRINSMAIRTKIPLAFAVVFCLILLLGVLAILRIGAVNEQTTILRNSWLPSTAVNGKLLDAISNVRLRELRFIVNELVGTPDQRPILETELRQAMAKAAKDRADYQPLISQGTSDADYIKVFDDNWTLHTQQVNQIIADVHAEDLKSALALLKGGDRKTGQVAVRAINDDLDFNVGQGKLTADKGAAVYEQTKTVVIVALVITALLSVGLGALLVTAVSTPIQRMTEAMRRLAAHDLAAEVPGLDRRDEIGAMAGAVQIFKDSMIEGERLAAAAREEQTIKENRVVRIETLNRGFDATARAALDMLGASARTLHTTSNGMLSNAELAGSQANAVAAAADDASSNVETVAAATEELTASIQEISRQVAQSASIAGDAVSAAGETTGTMRELFDAAQKIGAVVSLINDIASQTNLLALNATIEAARAGEAGKGFAVVASEVKSLATQTARATEDIASQITAMQNRTGAAVSAIEHINTIIGHMNDISASIAAAVEEQTAATQEIARNVQEASKGTSEVSRNVGGLHQIVAETGVAATEVRAAAEALGRQSEALRANVGSFLADIGAA